MPPSAQASERRARDRHDVDVPVTVRDAAGRAFLCRIANVSGTGALLTCDLPTALTLGRSRDLDDPRIILTVVRPGVDGGARQRVSTHAEVVHVTPETGGALVGCRIPSTADEDDAQAAEGAPFVAAVDHA